MLKVAYARHCFIDSFMKDRALAGRLASVMVLDTLQMRFCAQTVNLPMIPAFALVRINSTLRILNTYLHNILRPFFAPVNLFAEFI